MNHPEEIVHLDEKLNVVILDFDDAKKRIALGLKQLSPHPWDALDTELKVGDKVKGKVVVMADYGAFNAVWDAWVVDGYEPARSVTGGQLAVPEYKIKISVTAAL